MKLKLNERIKLLREEQKLTQKELAAIIGVTQSLIARWERGTLKVKIKYIKPICLYFHVSADFLLGLSDIRNRNKR